MEAYVTDEQQLEAIRKWFKQHGKHLLTAVLVVAVIGMSIRYWFHHQEVNKIEASEEYTMLLMSQSQEDKQSAQFKAKSIIQDYPNTPYASLAGLYLAKLAVQDGEIEQALDHLERVIDGSVEEFALVARVRAARIYLNEGQYDKALNLVEVKDADGYSPLLEEIKGDVFAAQNQTEKARNAYEKALLLSVEKELENPLLTLKVQELGGKIPESKEDV